MGRYAVLLLPAVNRVYAEASARLTHGELAVLNQAVLGGRLRELAPTVIGGVPYVGFSASGLSDRDVAFLSNLSSAYALFEVAGPLLRPLPLARLDRFDDDLVSIQRYQGKTNEHFTKLLLNVTLLSTAFPERMLERKLAVLDPLCGRGTTLNQALMYGFDAAGMEISTADFEAYCRFILTWLQRKRLKHRADVGPVRRDGRVVGRRLQVTLAATRELFKAGVTVDLTVVGADTTAAAEFFRPGSFDVVATDAPYGVRHGSRTPARGRSRSPLELLEAAVPVWAGLLRPGGALGISWNTQVARREQLVEMLRRDRLEVLDAGAYRRFAHRVDQAITRDLVVARKASSRSLATAR
jgi:SAM-dependent methyltransferase